MRKYLLLFLLCCLATTACENARFGGREKGALGGAAIGAGLGAIIGAATGHAGVGTAIGGGIGALSGAAIGNEVDKSEAREQAYDDKLAENDRILAENQKLIEELKKRGTDARITDRGVVVNLPDVLFEFDSARLTGAAFTTIEDIAEVSAGRSISVEGHTDSVGTDSYNQRLSEDRARAVARELGYKGVPSSKIHTRGLGESRPIASNATEVGRARNRRVEVILEN